MFLILCLNSGKQVVFQKTSTGHRPFQKENLVNLTGTSPLPILHLVTYISSRPQRALDSCPGVTYIIISTLHTLPSIIHPPHFTIHSPLYPLHTTSSTIYSSSTLHSPPYIFHSPPTEIRLLSQNLQSLLFESMAKVLINICEHTQFLTFSISKNRCSKGRINPSPTFYRSPIRTVSPRFF